MNKKIGLFTCVILFASLGHAKPKNNAFVNNIVGFSLAKPSQWHFMSAEQHHQNLRNIKLNKVEQSEALQKYATTPLVVIAKHKEPYRDVNPSFKVNIKPLGQLDGNKPNQILKLLLPSFKKMFGDMKVIVKPKLSKVSGLKAGYTKFNYTMNNNQGGSFEITSELWIIPRGDSFFIIGAGTRQDEKTGKRAEVQKIIDSVKITRI